MDGEEAEHANIDQLIAQRNQARADKDFASADKIRDQLAAMNIEILDSAEDTRWRKK
jgi:cysteinyl-tRNA synthetase